MDSNVSCWSPSFFSQPGLSRFHKSSNIAATVIAIAYPGPTSFGHAMENTAYRHSISIGNDNVNCNNVTNSHNNTVNVSNIIADENPEIMKWLSPLDPRGRHHDVRTDRVDGVGSWLLETKEFREWRSNGGGAEKAVLFCYGNPGVGKTYLR